MDCEVDLDILILLLFIDNLVMKAAELTKLNRMSSANSSFSSYAGDPDEQGMSCEKFGTGGFGPDQEMYSEKSVTSRVEVSFDDKYEFIDNKILGEVSQSTI